MSGSLLGRLTTWAAGLRLPDVPQRVTDLAVSQVISQLAAIRAGLQHRAGAPLVRAYGPPLQPDPARSAAVLAVLGSWLNLDDTAYAGHLGPSTVAVPLAYAHAGGLTGEQLVTAVIAANECAARITAAATLGPLRGQSALHTHLAGAVAGRMHASGQPAGRWRDALALAFAAPPWPIMHAFLGGDAKLLHALTPVRTAMDACDAANAGLSGTPDVLEHPRGFLARFATVALPGEVVAYLGERWHTETLSFKLRPGGPGVDAAVDCARELHGTVAGAVVEEVVIEASAYTLFAGAQAAPYLDDERSPLSALLLSVAYPVATALLTGDLAVADFEEPALRDPARWALARRIRLEQDESMTRELLASTAPFGAALRAAGERGGQWLESFVSPAAGHPGPGRPDAGFATAGKATPARVTVRFADGRSVTSSRSIPLGAAGADTATRHRALVREKFLRQGGDPEVADECEILTALPADRLRALVEAALRPGPAVSAPSGAGQAGGAACVQQRTARET